MAKLSHGATTNNSDKINLTAQYQLNMKVRISIMIYIITWLRSENLA